MKVVENLFLKKKLMVKNSFIKKTYVVGTHWNCNVYLQHMLPKTRKETVWKFTFSKYHVHCLYLFNKCLNIPNCLSVLNSCHFTTNCLYLHGSYFSKFEFIITFLLTSYLCSCNERKILLANYNLTKDFAKISH